MSMNDVKVCVIGAGMAGLSAALRLVEGGASVTVLEARNRVGGRILSEQVAGIHVEMGAEFVHGLPPDTFTLLRQFGLAHDELDGENLVYDREGGLHPQEEDSAEDESPFTLLDAMTGWAEMHPHRDLTFAAYLAQEGVPSDDAAGVIRYVEGFNAADHTLIGVQGLARQQRAEEEIEGGRAFHLHDGYAALPHAMAEHLQSQGVQIVLNTQVASVRWDRGTAKIETTDGHSYQANAVVITLPLPLLQKRIVRFLPEPTALLKQADRMKMGHACRISLVFKRRWWAEMDHPQHSRLKKLSFLFPARRQRRPESPRFGAFWTPYPDEAPMITAWTGGHAADLFTGLSPEQMQAIALQNLEAMFGLAEGSLQKELVATRMHDWQADPLTGGAYSYVPAGAVDASEAMCLPVKQTLFFAGEHTDISGHWGTVHGAIRSGVRAARQVLDTFKRGL